MGKGRFPLFSLMGGRQGSSRVLGWQYEMIYLGGDPYNPQQAVVTVRALEKAIVIRAADGREETFHSLLIPYAVVEDLRLADAETGRGVSLGEKAAAGDVFENVFLRYRDNGTPCTLELCMSMAADMYQNSRLCRNMQEYVASRLKRMR